MAAGGLPPVMVWSSQAAGLREEPVAWPDYPLAPQPILLLCDPPTPYRPRHPENDAIVPQPRLQLGDAPAQYQPRHPEKTAVYQLFQDHFDDYIQAYEERFESRSGPLRPVVVHSVEEFLTCGRLQGGFARIRCPKCRDEHLVVFSCRTRGGLCSSCQAKRAVLFAEKLTGDILAPVPHRHWTFSIPRALRGLVERERSLVGLLSRTAYETIRKSFQALFERNDVHPGCVIAFQSFGAYGANFNPHLHAIISV
jgi:ribosomal protein S27E